MHKSHILLFGFALGSAAPGAASASAPAILSSGAFFEAQYSEAFGGAPAGYSMQIGGWFYPSNYSSIWGANPTLGQINNFWTSQSYTATATQAGTVPVNLSYTDSPADPLLFYTTIPFNANALGSWNVNVSYPGYTSATVQTNNIQSLQPFISNPPSQPPVVQNLTVDGLSTTPTVSWRFPSITSLAGSGLSVNTQFLIFDATQNNEYIDFYDFNGAVTSLPLANLPPSSTSPGGPLTVPLTVGDSYVFSVVMQLNDSSGNAVFLSRSYSSPFTPSISSAAFSGPIYLPSTTTAAGQTIYNFDMTVTNGQTYNLDPALAEGFIYGIGAGDPNFASVELPGNNGDYALYLWEGGKWVFDASIAPDTVFDFARGGVSEFEILGIDPGVDPSSGTAFMTQVTFEGDGQFTGTMTAVIPEPSTWTLMVAGFAGLGLVGRRAMRLAVRA
jgi:hypothetical protein